MELEPYDTMITHIGLTNGIGTENMRSSGIKPSFILRKGFLFQHLQENQANLPGILSIQKYLLHH
ncbi:hypothetical protein [Paenibacillus polymyxa]|uniref:hypothetical protein n=1 Tax=Paenibacillus polymyxa TaxID=1406 RepID=UPI002377F6EA|nr:hypothetical protein [Paenibacillus polymyxa]